MKEIIFDRSWRIKLREFGGNGQTGRAMSDVTGDAVIIRRWVRFWSYVLDKDTFVGAIEKWMTLDHSDAEEAHSRQGIMDYLYDISCDELKKGFSDQVEVVFLDDNLNSRWAVHESLAY